MDFTNYTDDMLIYARRDIGEALKCAVDMAVGGSTGLAGVRKYHDQLEACLTEVSRRETEVIRARIAEEDRLRAIRDEFRELARNAKNVYGVSLQEYYHLPAYASRRASTGAASTAADVARWIRVLDPGVPVNVML